MTEKEKEIAKKVFELFVMAQYRYLILNKKGNYQTFDTYKSEKAYKLNSYIVHRHLNGEATLGVFSSTNHTKFLCFDVDVIDKIKAKWTVYRLVNCLIEIGIPDDDIHISLSGNKGYHVELYFNEPIKNDYAYEFYKLVTNTADLLNIDYGQVEYRPNAMKQGVKIPLGINFKNSRKPRCWYVNYEKGLKPIRRLDYILRIEQMDVGIIFNILERERDRYEEEEVREVEETRGHIESKYTPLKIYKENHEEKETIESIEKLLFSGLTRIGERHNSLYKLAKYFRHQGHTNDDCSLALIEWMYEQDTRCYTTKLDDCIKDIKLIVKYVYDNEIRLTIEEKDIFITYEEMKQILQVQSKNQKLLAYCLLIHSKRYALKNGNFYMTYKQMSEASGLVEKTMRNLINKLEQTSILKIIERNRKVKDKNGKVIHKEKKPNIYNLNIGCNEDINPSFKVVYKNIDYSESFNRCILHLFDRAYLKKTLPRRQYVSIAG